MTEEQIGEIEEIAELPWDSKEGVNVKLTEMTKGLTAYFYIGLVGKEKKIFRRTYQASAKDVLLWGTKNVFVTYEDAAKKASSNESGVYIEEEIECNETLREPSR